MTSFHNHANVIESKYGITLIKTSNHRTSIASNKSKCEQKGKKKKKYATFCKKQNEDLTKYGNLNTTQ